MAMSPPQEAHVPRNDGTKYETMTSPLLGQRDDENIYDNRDLDWLQNERNKEGNGSRADDQSDRPKSMIVHEYVLLDYYIEFP
jgi:hypothetical protein